MKDDFLIFQKAYDFVILIFPIITKMPKDHRFILGQQLEEKTLSIVDLIVTVNKLNTNDRKKYFTKFSDAFDLLIFRIRLSRDLKLITEKQYMRIIEKENELIKLIHNWLH